MANVLEFKGHRSFRYRIILATLTGKTVRISDIRPTDDDPGLREFEINFLRFVDKMTNGARIVPSETGTSVLYQPGILIGGIVKHECCLDRGIGYILEAAMELAPFCKTPLELTLGGVTSNEIDPSVDRIKDSGIPVLKRFMTGDYEVILTINKRGAAPNGGGEVFFKCSTVKSLKTIQLKDSGLVKRIRGIAYGVRVSPGIPHRMIETAKGSLLKFIPDVYINIDEKKGKSGGKSPGFGITLTAETINGIFYSGEAVSPIRDPNADPCFPEDIGKEAANKLFDEIYRNGTVDSPFQSMTALFMAFSGRDVSKVVVGPFTPAMIQFLRDLKVFTGVTFRLANVTDDEGNQLQQVHMTCSGIGFSNMSRRAI
ncbi:RNA 3'-terminal phosphate cyclase-like protein [Trichogramma pretiosum]|uniref:RNA 3'-terminal phosphate cyclase-like protein n=1 Tax=Trichogramma pretiosum TaxID=7493 RepID=UPI0006C9415C|nr:RNA 3'-terminal phosphate cyclase-like protein [Trichogramma pretiosum]